eukprot:gene9591-10601_t
MEDLQEYGDFFDPEEDLLDEFLNELSSEDWQWSPSNDSPVSCGSSGSASSSTAPPDLVLCPVPNIVPSVYIFS